jgi:hypothetical protein
MITISIVLKAFNKTRNLERPLKFLIALQISKVKSWEQIYYYKVIIVLFLHLKYLKNSVKLPKSIIDN